MPLRSKRNRNSNRSNREKPKIASDIKSENPLVFFAAKFPHSSIHHYASIYGALLLSVSPVGCTCIIKYGAVRKFFLFRENRKPKAKTENAQTAMNTKTEKPI